MTKQAPTFDQVLTWCETNDNHAAEGWLCLLLDGTYSADELRAAILADRAPERASTLDVALKSLADQVRGLPEYRGWYLTCDDNREMFFEKLVWQHEDYDTKIWLDLVRKSRDQIDLSIDIDDPNDDPSYPQGTYETLSEQTAAAVFTVCKRFLDAYGSNEVVATEPDK